MNNIHSPIALKKGDRIVIGCYDGPEPPHWKELLCAEDYARKDRYLKWQASYKEYAVREADKEAIKALLHEHYFISNFEVFAEKGIDCTFLKDRLKRNLIFKVDRTTNDPDIYEWTLLPLEDKNIESLNFENFKKQFTESFGKVTPQEFVKEMEGLGYEFKPLDDKKENEDDMWEEVKSTISMYFFDDERFETVVEKLKSKYTITRKPTIQEPE